MSDHIGDTNKMISDTPRTDEEAGYYDQSGCWKHDTNGECVTSDFARELERELNAANSEVDRLTRKVALLYEGAEEQNQRIQLLIAERDTARAVADQNRNLRREFELLLGTSDITTGIGIVKTLVQASKDNVELRKQVREQKTRIKRLAQSCVAKDEQLCNLLNICRSNGIEVSSQDLLNGTGGSMSRYKYTKLRNLGPVHGFLIQTPDDRQLKDVYLQFIVRELNRLNNKIKRMELAGHHLCCWLDRNTPLGVKNDWMKAKEQP